MIVPMKKVSLVVIDAHREASLEKLRDLGVLHLESTDATSDALTGLVERRSLLQNALRLLPEPEEPPERTEAGAEEALETATQVIRLAESIQKLTEETGRLRREAAELEEWGDFDPADILALREKGIDIRLCRVPRRHAAELPEGARLFVLKEGKSVVNAALVLTDGADEIPFDEVPLPDRGLSEVNVAISTREREMEAARRELKETASRTPAMEAALEELDGGIEFETARAGMGVEEKLAFLTGYAPDGRVRDLKKAAAENGWALLVTEPSDDDPVPTLIENPKWIRIIDPVFKLMGTVPGYTEYDISMWFLAFFSVFFAMLIGDAGYGAVLLVLTLVGRMFMRKLPSEPFVLMYVLSICTLVWGAVSGNWFGCEAIAHTAPFDRLVVPALNTFSAESGFYVQYICFVLGAVHLSLAHLMVGLRSLNSLKALAQLGWIMIIWAMFLVIRTIMLEAALDTTIVGALGVAGLALVVFFSWPSRNILWTILYGIAEVPMNVVDVFKDSLSYIRLFAVGMATFYVAQSFNSLAASVGFSNVLRASGAIVIILIGHGMNIILALMSVAVHGFRLNMLEFSGHVGMAWAGKEYRPFCRKTETEKGVA